MSKRNLKVKLIPILSWMAIPSILASVAYAAVTFVPSDPTVIGYIAQPALSSNNLSTGNGLVFRGEYEKGSWSGNLSCYPISSTGVVDLTVPCWSSGAGATYKVGAQSQVDLQGFADGSRNIATLNTTGFAVPFTVNADTVNLVDAAHVDFIRGDRSKEAPAGALRTRNSALGDTIHSRPFYLDDGVSPTVFYGANDGMLHAIDAKSGRERWAYIPSMLIPKLNKLWASNYVHEYYVDGGVNIANVGTSNAPRNILVGSLGAGGKGIYALDVSNLAAGSDSSVAAKALWEITPTTIARGGNKATSNSYVNMGDNITTSTMYPVQNGANAVIVGNGYNNTGNGHATLLVIDSLTGSLIREIDTGVAGTGGPNGLSSPAAVDNNRDGKVDTVYAGDIDGNMWKFNMLDTNPGNWSASLLYSTKSNPATPAGQAITMQPSVADRTNGGGVMVTFATGRLFTTADSKDTSVNYAYGVWDGADPSNTTMAKQFISVRNYLPGVGANPVPVRVIGKKPADAAVVPNWNKGGDKGWVTELPVAGERVTGDSAFILNGLFYFNVTNPLVVYNPTGWPVGSGLGENWLMELDFMTGGAPSQPFFDMNGDGSVTDADRVQYVAGDQVPPPSLLGDPITTSFGVPIGLMSSNGVQSQPILGNGGYFSALFYNNNSDVTPSSPNPQPPPPGATGIGNGHFDVDNWYHTTNNSAANATRSSTNGVTKDYGFVKHDHEYDKIWNVNGVNLLNPSGQPIIDKNSFWMGNAVNTTTPYKVLVFNQGWNRAARLKIGPNNWISTKQFQTQAGLTVASLPTYTGNTEDVTTVTLPLLTVKTSTGTGGVAGTTRITNLQIDMPYNAFSVLDWWKDGVSMNGLIPVGPNCVATGNGGGTSTGAENKNKSQEYYTGPKQERNDGALTIQIIRADTPDTAIQLNVNGPVTIGGKVYPPEAFGYRVKDADINKYVMYEEAVYWHHPTGLCMGDTTSNPFTSNGTNSPGNNTQIVAATAGSDAKCSNNGVVVPEDPTTCTGADVTQASCTSGKYTAAKPATPEFPVPATYTGWTYAAPPDTRIATKTPSPRPCGTNDPHDANFTPSVNQVGGGGGGGANPPPPPPPSTYPANVVGGTSSKVTILTPCGKAGQAACPTPTCGEVGQPACNTNCGGRGQPACCGGLNQPACAPPCVGVDCNKCAVGDPLCNPRPPHNATGRLSWHELIGE